MKIARNGAINGASGYQYDAATPYMQSYNMTIERSLGSAAVELGYSGSRGTHLGRLHDINTPRQNEATYKSGVALATLRAFPFFDGTVNMFDFQGNSVYNAGQVSLRKRGAAGRSTA